jgi:hypothetical protein
MKTTLLLFLTIISGYCWSSETASWPAKINPIIVQYIQTVERLCTQMESTQESAVIAACAKKLMKVSDEAEEFLIAYYGYRSSMVTTVFVLQGSTILPAIALTQQPQPRAIQRVNHIFDLSAKIRFIHRKNSKKLGGDITRIRQELQMLQMMAED